VDARLQALLNPSFAKDPPVKLNISAKTLGGVYALLGAIAAVVGLVGVLGLLGVGSYLAYVGVGGLIFLVALGNLISVIGTGMAAWGGYRMYQEDHDGKRVVIYGLALSVVGGFVAALGTFGGGILGWIISLAITFVLYYLVIISRFDNETKLV